jgi:bifunctional oligoribonuclease and PAP phosphatase NrnA
VWREIKRVIQTRRSFLITTHLNPDGDGIGSAVAMAELLRHFGKKVRIVIDSPLPQNLSFLNFHSLIEEYQEGEGYEDVQVVVIVDTNKRSRIGRVAELLDRKGMISICIDHHVGGERFTTYSAIDPETCSAGALVYTLCKESGYPLNVQAATGIYTSVVCDTGRFSYSSTSRKAHKLADECLKLGVDPELMHRLLFQVVPLEQVRLFAKAMERLEFYFNDKILIQSILRSDCVETGASPHDVDYLHEFHKSIQGIQCAVLLRELEDGRIRISLRANAAIPIDRVMEALGGGGHNKAAGATVSGEIEEVKKRVLLLLEPYIS